MIREIRIRNLALIDDLTLELREGFTVFTGETGAGKSILVGAIGLLLGDRAQSEHIRMGTEEAEIQAQFDLPWQPPQLVKVAQEAGLSLEDNTLVIRRIVSRSGRNRIYVNGTAIVLGTLRALGSQLVDMHGQHDHQSLLLPDTARLIIDSLPAVAPLAQGYRSSYNAFTSSKEQLAVFDHEAAQKADRREYTEFKLKEIAALNLKHDEELLLEKEMTLLSSSTERVQCAQAILDACNGIEGAGISSLAAAIRKNLERLSRLDESAQQWIADIESARAVFTEIETYAARYAESAAETANPARLEQINNRLAKIQRLKKKHSCSCNELLELQQRLSTELADLDNTQSDREQLLRALEKNHKECFSTGKELGTARRKEAQRFATQVTSQLVRLGFEDGALRFDFPPASEPGPQGLEGCFFMVRTNKGEPFLPLEKTASGGEISRLMLAMKTVLSKEDPVAVLVFDEVDTGIGGMVAQEVAESLYALSARRQVLCISHLHQIAALADHHVRVYKTTQSDRTITQALTLSAQQRIDEIARMLGGKTEIARNHAQELLNKSKRPNH